MLENYPLLNFPEVKIILEQKEGKNYIYDAIRKKKIVLQPEEWVRQHVVQFLISYKSFPLGLMTEEFSIKYDRMNKRIDLLVYNNELKPILLAEFKSFDIPITNETFLQASVYNHTIKAPYLYVSNGLVSYCAVIDFSKNSITYLEEIPDYKNL